MFPARRRQLRQHLGLLDGEQFDFRMARNSFGLLSQVNI